MLKSVLVVKNNLPVGIFFAKNENYNYETTTTVC